MAKLKQRGSGRGDRPEADRRGGDPLCHAAAAPAIRSVRVLLRTSGMYVVLVLVLLSVLRTRFVEQALLDPFKTAVAGITTHVLHLLGVAAVHEGVYITGPDLSVAIANECTGLEAVVLLVPAILVFPAGWRAKSRGLALSLGVMAMINLVRVVSLCYLATHSDAWLQVGHLYVWPTVVIIAGLLTLLFWVERIAIPVHR